MKYKIFRPNGLVYETNSYFKLICYAIFIRQNKQLLAAIINVNERASSHEFYIYGNNIEHIIPASKFLDEVCKNLNIERK